MTHHYDSSASGYLSDSFEGISGTDALCPDMQAWEMDFWTWTFGR